MKAHIPPPAQTEELPVRPEPAREWAVEIVDSGGLRRVPLAASAVTFGTSKLASVRIYDPSVSALHCELALVGGMVSVRDCGSRNGTFVGGARVHAAYAMAGEVVTVGRSTIAIKAVTEDGDDEHGPPLEGVIGESLVMRKLADRVRKFAALRVPVLIVGETGSGKDLIARAIHRESARAQGPFVPINVGALPRELVESEMFGHERGAFTGAHQKHRGAFADADGGTLFLDEIGDLPLDAQPKLLRALDGYEIKRVGQDGAGQRFDTRVIAATHVNLKERVLSGAFRQDLFHRLEAIVVRVPPLRLRRGDIPLLATKFLAELDLTRPSSSSADAKESLRPKVRLLADAASLLAAHDWPGNVRELRHVLFRAAVETERDLLSAQDIRAAMDRASDEHELLTPVVARECLAKWKGNISRAARDAGLPRTTFRRRLNGMTGDETDPPSGPPASSRPNGSARRGGLG